MNKVCIYADNAATTKLSTKAFDSMKPFLLENYGNASQPYSFSRRSRKALNDARKLIAECIGAYPDEIYFTSGGTESDNWVIKCCKNDVVVTSKIEHHAILNSCKQVSDGGKKVIYLPVDSDGVIDAKEYKMKLKLNNVDLVSIMMANNEIGTIEPIKELCQIAHENGALFHTDAVQAIGHIPIDVHDLNVDFLSASAHKFNGPKGIGFLYIKREIAIKSFNSGGAQENGLRAGTENVASIVGMATALEENISNLHNNINHLRNLEDLFMANLNNSNIPYRRNGVNQLPGLISLSIKDTEGEVLFHRLDLKGIYISTGSACDSKNTKVTHVIKAINVPEEFKHGTIRVSFSHNNSLEEANLVSEELIDIIKSLHYDKL